MLPEAASPLLISLVTLLLVVLAAIVALAAQMARRLQALAPQLQAVEKTTERNERLVRDEMATHRQELALGVKHLREELQASLRGMNDSLVRAVAEFGATQHAQLQDQVGTVGQMIETHERRQQELRQAVERHLEELQQDNSAKLEQMRQTVEEKLHGMLETRLGESFKLVSYRMEQVHKVLGEMQSLALGVGYLKRILTNVKTRGTWGEVKLGSLLGQLLDPEQYLTNVRIQEDSDERVEFAIRLPGQGPGGFEVLLPIDAKCPVEDYQRLVEASEGGNPEKVEAFGKELEATIKGCAKQIRMKYIHPPRTTDFAILYLPTEGLYSEVLRRIGLTEGLQRDFRVVVAGPTTLTAIVSSLQMGFRTLAIQQRSSEVWRILGAVKTEFGKFGEMLSKVQKKLTEASNTIDQAAKRHRAIDRELRDVEALPAAGPLALGTLDDGDGADDGARDHGPERDPTPLQQSTDS